jgi:protein-S-isoprenylcysteine O-methyltransferase Ste14
MGSTMADARDVARLKRVMLVRVPAALAVLLALWLTAAGTTRYWQAWAMAGTFLALLFLVGTYYLRTDPDFLVHRMQVREKEAAQKRVIRIWTPLTIALILLPAFDTRFGWSRVPDAVCVAGLLLMLAAYAFVIWVFRTNRYASRTIEVQAGQTVISSGPYAVVRHPMYAAQFVMFPALIVALGSWWAAAASVLIVVPIVLRIRNEEEVLRRELPGYADYCARVRYRLLPGVW